MKVNWKRVFFITALFYIWYSEPRLVEVVRDPCVISLIGGAGHEEIGNWECVFNDMKGL